MAGILNKIKSYYGCDNSDKLKAMLQLLWNNKLLLLFTTLSPGIMEELLFRGNLMPSYSFLQKIPGSLLLFPRYFSGWRIILMAVGAK